MTKKIAEVQTYKQVSSTVEEDLNKLKDCITELEELLTDGDFTAGDVHNKVDELEELAKAIASGVIDRSVDCEY